MNGDQYNCFQHGVKAGRVWGKTHGVVAGNGLELVAEVVLFMKMLRASMKPINDLKWHGTLSRKSLCLIYLARRNREFMMKAMILNQSCGCNE